MSRFLTHAAVYALMERDGRLLMLRRANTGYRDGDYGLPSGHIEEGESPMTAVAREVHEEVGVEVDGAGMDFAHVIYRQYSERTYNDYFAMDNLPVNIVPEVKLALECVARGEKFSQLDLR